MVNEIINKLKEGKLDDPNELANDVVILSASLNTGGQMELEAEVSYARKWQELRELCKSDKDCDMRAKLTEEYVLMRKAQIANKTIQECIRSLKKKLTNLSFEWHEGQNYGRQ